MDTCFLYVTSALIRSKFVSVHCSSLFIRHTRSGNRELCQLVTDDVDCIASGQGCMPEDKVY